jgi:hypothetical protein
MRMTASEVVIEHEPTLVLAQSDLIGRKGRLASGCKSPTGLRRLVSNARGFRL